MKITFSLAFLANTMVVMDTSDCETTGLKDKFQVIKYSMLVSEFTLPVIFHS
jgi:hypothetical protein